MSMYKPGFLHQLKDEPPPAPFIPATTDDLPEGVNNKYFTEARVRATPLTGLTAVTAGVISPTDSILLALAKLQAQLALYVPVIFVDYGIITSAATVFIDYGLVTDGVTTTEDWASLAP